MGYSTESEEIVWLMSTIKTVRLRAVESLMFAKIKLSECSTFNLRKIMWASVVILILSVFLVVSSPRNSLCFVVRCEKMAAQIFSTMIENNSNKLLTCKLIADIDPYKLKSWS